MLFKILFLCTCKRKRTDNKLLCVFFSFWHIQICTSEDECRFGRVSELFVYEKFNRVPAETVEAGDICAVCGIDDIQVE